jgi:regulator of protease activity HflC (stomatin/prohibitin superfamily)
MAKYPESLDDTPPPKRRRRWWNFAGRNLPGFSITLMAILLLGIVLWPHMVITVPSGQVGVLWYRFLGLDAYCWCFVNRGTVLNPREVRGEGLHIIAPWNRLFLYDLRLQSKSETYHAISKDGVSVIAQINVRFQLLHDSVGVLHKFIGPGYFETVLGPEIGAQAREVISRYTAQEVYVSRDKIQQEIRDSAQKSLAGNLNKLVQPTAMEEMDPQHYNSFLESAILILDTLVLGIDLPPDIVAAINRQAEQFYMIQEYKYRVEREAEESQRKMIEANGIAAFQRTVSQGISESYLRWQGINATLALAQSPNSKVVIIGSGKDGLPIILGNVDAPAAGAAAQPGAGETKSPAPSLPGGQENAPAEPSPKSSAIPGEQQFTKDGLTAAPRTDSGSPWSGDAPAATSPTLGGSATKAPDSSKPGGLPSLNSVLSRIYGVVRPPPAAPEPGPRAQSNP